MLLSRRLGPSDDQKEKDRIEIIQVKNFVSNGRSRIEGNMETKMEWVRNWISME